MEKVGARGSRGFPWSHGGNESAGVTPEARKHTVAHDKNIAFGDERTPWRTDGRGSGTGRGQLSRFPPHTEGKAHPGVVELLLLSHF